MKRDLLYNEIAMLNIPIKSQFGIVDTKLINYIKAITALKNELSNRAGKSVPFTNPAYTLLNDFYIKSAFSNYPNNPALNALLKAFEQEYFSSSKLPSIVVSEFATKIIQLLERQFIIDPTTSSLDLLPNNEGDKYRKFRWKPTDFPGNGGSNEDLATKMANDLIEILPERRANQGAYIVMSKSNFLKNKSKLSTILGSSLPFEMVDIGGEKHKQVDFSGNKEKLNKVAMDSFIMMRHNAAQDGIPLIILSGFRIYTGKIPVNRKAKAGFSSHHLGLAMDIKMGMTTVDINQNKVKKIYKEIHTNPMQKVVEMRTSPIHKWMFIHGYKYGWYPYMNEPWHWEYNPEGFKEIFEKMLITPSEHEFY